MPEAVLETSLPGLPPPRRGKVRDVYDLGDRLLLVATDRISAFDCVLSPGIPDKGKILTQLSNFWFRRFAEVVPNHLIETDASRFPAARRRARGAPLGPQRPREEVRRRPVRVRGPRLPRGLRLEGVPRVRHRLRHPAPEGAARGGPAARGRSSRPPRRPSPGTTSTSRSTPWPRRRGRSSRTRLRSLTLELYSRAAAYAAGRGIVLADTKFEFGLDPSGAVVWIDEVLTPDSSRFWPADTWRPGRLAAVLRQAVRARLPREDGLEQDAARAGPASGRRRGHAARATSRRTSA